MPLGRPPELITYPKDGSEKESLGKKYFHFAMCDIFVQPGNTNKGSMYKSDIEEDEEGRVIDVILHVNVHGLKFEKGKRCPQSKMHLSVSCFLLRAIKLTETVQNVNFQNSGNINDKQLSSTINISNPSHIQSTDVFSQPKCHFRPFP